MFVKGNTISASYCEDIKRLTSYLGFEPVSIIFYLVPYLFDLTKGNISLYARGEDYHIVAKKYLNEELIKLQSQYPDNNFKITCDSVPLEEVKGAAKAGLGVVGKNNLLINKEFGSYCFIAEIVADLELPYNECEINSCNLCNKCHTVCTSGALSKDGFKKELCVSYLTQKKGELSETEKDIIKKSGMVWGCDRCQTSCLLNKNAGKSAIPEFCKEINANFDGIEHMNKAYMWRGLDILKRNSKIIE